MGSRSIVYVGIYALIYLHSILGDGIVSRDGLPRGVLPSAILKIEKYCPALKVRSPCSRYGKYDMSHIICSISYSFETQTLIYDN